MADLDAELLALAGGDSSDEESPKPTTSTTKVESPQSSAGSPIDNANGAFASKAVVPQKKSSKPKAGAKKGTKKTKRDESEEEGEASSAAGSPDSLDSAPMSESDADVAPAVGEDNDEAIFPVDNKFYSEKDKAEIMALPEVRREQILAERAVVLERKQQDQILRRLYQNYQGKEVDKSKGTELKKRKAGNTDLEDVQRKSSRQKTTLGGRKVGETSDAMEAYKRQREMKGVMVEQRKTEAAERKARKGRGSSSLGSEADADGESEVEWDDGKPRAGRRSESAPRDVPAAEQIDYEHVRVGRDNFAKVCYYPGFDETIKNCFVRVCIGPDRATGENVYRMASIKKLEQEAHTLLAFTEGKPYAIEGPNGKLFTTSQYVLVAVGKAEKEWPFIACSNSKFTVREYERWKKTMAADGLTVPTKASLIQKIDAINKLINHRFTEVEIQEKLVRSGVLLRKNNSIERASLLTRREEARVNGDQDIMDQIDAKLLELEGPKLAFGTSLVKKVVVPKGLTQQERLGEINRANRKANTIHVRKAQQKERRAEMLNRAAVARGEAVPNPFARVKVMAKTHYDVNEHLKVPKTSTDDLFSGSEGGSRAATPGTATPKKEPLAAKAPSPPKSSEWLIMPQHLEEEAFLKNMDFGIDIEV
ncbi:hypothetical protein MMC18_009261 [Xylographa bjoerkii]|nr:hypothetical protein [Xylographa bjoerkii]